MANIIVMNKPNARNKNDSIKYGLITVSPPNNGIAALSAIDAIESIVYVEFEVGYDSNL